MTGQPGEARIRHRRNLGRGNEMLRARYRENPQLSGPVKSERLPGERRQLIILRVRPAEFNHYVLSLDIAGIKQSLLERRYDGESGRLRPAVQETDRGITCCCARGASGHATATPPNTPRNSRRLMPHSRFRRRHFTGANEYAGERLFTYTRLPPCQWKSARTTNAIERSHEEFKRRIKTQTVLPSAETAAMLLALLASGQISMRKIDGWQTLASKPWWSAN